MFDRFKLGQLELASKNKDKEGKTPSYTKEGNDGTIKPQTYGRLKAANAAIAELEGQIKSIDHNQYLAMLNGDNDQMNALDTAREKIKGYLADVKTQCDNALGLGQDGWASQGDNMLNVPSMVDPNAILLVKDKGSVGGGALIAGNMGALAGAGIFSLDNEEQSSTKSQDLFANASASASAGAKLDDKEQYPPEPMPSPMPGPPPQLEDMESYEEELREYYNSHDAWEEEILDIDIAKAELIYIQQGSLREATQNVKDLYPNSDEANILDSLVNHSTAEKPSNYLNNSEYVYEGCIEVNFDEYEGYNEIVAPIKDNKEQSDNFRNITNEIKLAILSFGYGNVLKSITVDAGLALFDISTEVVGSNNESNKISEEQQIEAGKYKAYSFTNYCLLISGYTIQTDYLILVESEIKNNDTPNIHIVKSVARSDGAMDNGETSSAPYIDDYYYKIGGSKNDN